MDERESQLSAYKYNPSYYGVENIVIRDISKATPIKRLRLLDVGCNEGYFGEKLLQCDPDVECHGIELDQKAAQKAALVYKSVQKTNLNVNKISELPFPTFDRVVFLDVLEHLINPQAVLQDVKQVLANHAVVYVSLPNVAHFSIRIALLFGRFNYKKNGILDRTHLHLYTVKSARELLESSGYTVVGEFYASNRFGAVIRLFPFLGSVLGFNLILKAIPASEQLSC